MEIITGDREDLIEMLDDAISQVKQVKTREQKTAFYNFVGNLYGSINVNSELDFHIDYRDCFINRRNFKKFMKQADLYDKRFCSNFFDYKEFHKDYLGDILVSYGEHVQKLKDVPCSDESTWYLGKDKFYEILCGFLDEYGLLEKFKEFLKKPRVFSKIKKNPKDDYSGLTIFNPINRDAAFLINNPDYDLDTLFIYIHEFGHVVDLQSIEGDPYQALNSYAYRSSYPEVFSKLLEKLFLQYLIDNNIMSDQAKDKYIGLFINNHDFLLSSYMFSLLDDKFYRGGKELCISNNQFVDEMCKYFSNRELIEEMINDGSMNLFGDYIYSYGEIMATHLLEPVKAGGLGCEQFRDFQRIRFQPFDPEFLIKNGYSAEKFAEVLEKEVQLCKK